MAGIFISYRRDDSRGFAGRAADDLADIFGHELVFRDLEIPIGSDFARVLEETIVTSSAALVVIGRRWADGSEHGFGQRLFDAEDWVRREIETALAQRKVVVPVLVDGARMPDPSQLPESLAPLLRLQAATLTDSHWDVDIESLASELRQLCPSLSVHAQRTRRHGKTRPAEELKELGDRVLDQLGHRQRERSPDVLASLLGRALRALWRRVSQVLMLLVFVALLYAGLKLFGDDQTLQDLDALEQRLAIGWQRLMGYLGPS